MKFFYQPEWPTTLTTWSYNIIILLISIIIWLELTYFQIWTVIFFLVFALIAGLQLLRRQVFVKADHLILRAVVPFNNKRIDYQEIKAVVKNKHGLVIKTKFRDHQLLLTKTSRDKLAEKLSKSISKVRV